MTAKILLINQLQNKLTSGFYVYAGNQGNASVNLGGSVTSIQPLRINLTSNENFTDKDWQITGIPRTLH